MRTSTLTCLLLLTSTFLSGCSDNEAPVDEKPVVESAPAARQEAPTQEIPQTDDSGQAMQEAIQRNNRGVGLMGSFDYPGALGVFEALVEDYPENNTFRFNQAVATLNRQLEGDEETALGQLETIVAAEPGNLNAHYKLGLLKLRKGDRTAADHLRKVLDEDPDDPYAAYYLGQALEQQGEREAALTLYGKVIEKDPYLRSAYYAAFLIHRRSGDREKARELLDVYQRMAGNPRAQLAEYKYTRMGPKANVLTLDEGNLPTAEPGEEIFGEPIGIASGLDGDSPNMTVADIDGDGSMDLFVAGASASDDQSSTVLIANGDGSFTADQKHPLASVDKVTAALWGDIDNDGLLDVYLCRNGANQLWKQVSQGDWENITSSSKTGGDKLNTIDGAIFDADHDGDLDIYTVNANGPNELFNNNLDGTFRRLAKERRIAGSGRGSRTVLTLDLDNDRDTDIVVINNRPPHDVYINDRLWEYKDAKGFGRFREAPIQNAVAADMDADGHPEIYTLNNQGAITRWLNDTKGGDWFEQPVLDMKLVDRLAILDLNGDGNLNLLASSPEKWLLVGPDSNTTGWKKLIHGDEPLGLFTGYFNGPGQGPSLITLKDQQLLLYPPGKGRLPFISVSLSGLHSDADSMRSNASGIGTRIALRQGSRWTMTDSFRHDTGPGQSLQPISIGLGGQARADFIALTWSDGVFQTELALEPGKLHAIKETQRQLSSCPVLFAWNGTQHAFISDILGVGGMGYMIAPGQYSTPRPHENYLLPVDSLKPLDGRYVLKVGEPMEEAAYIDAVRLVAYDLPPGINLVLDERMGVAGPQPTGRNLYYKEEMLPVKATGIDGKDVLDRVITADLKAPPVGELDKRFIGRLKEELVLTLEFDRPIPNDESKPVLMIDGWVEYPYSQTMFAAWQANAAIEAPSLDIRTAEGKWRTLYDQFGYPAGMPRRMALPLEKLPADATALRLRTNQEIYWDRVSIVYTEETDSVVKHALPLANAEVRHSGFALRTNGDQRQPHYDYSKRTPLWDTRYMSGYYTEYGKSTELVSETDDAVAIIGPGEEVHLEFKSGLPPLKPGWTRRFVVESNGWAKDMDLFTRDGETVGPLPSTGKPVVNRETLHTRYNTRFRSGY